jgi:hypothetical protein
MRDLIQWLRSPPKPLFDFFAYQKVQAYREEVKREQAWQRWKHTEDAAV